MEGIMQLYDWDDGLLAEFRYDGITERKRVMVVWKRRYAEHYKYCYYILTPFANPMKVKEGGLNFRAKLLPEEKPSLIS